MWLGTLSTVHTLYDTSSRKKCMFLYPPEYANEIVALTFRAVCFCLTEWLQVYIMRM